MHIIQAGISHNTAPVEIRERLALPDLPGALRVLCRDNGSGPGYALEGAVLSTCNRLEVYGVVEWAEPGQRDIRQYVAQASGVPSHVLDAHLDIHEDEAAIRHLCQVACGLDSMILGEPQIQGQVAEAHQQALDQGAAGPVISALFRTALQAGKRVRTETAIGEHATSISHVAVELALQIFDDLTTKTVLLIGAGEMAELAAKNLVDNGVGTLLVVNRSADRGASLAETYSGEALSWDQLRSALCRSDIVISSTAAPYAILEADLVTEVMRARRNRPLFLIDIAVPRDIDPRVGALPNIFLYDIDDLQQVLQANLVQRQREVPRALAIIDQEVTGYLTWLRAREVVPTIVDLRQHLDGIRQTELDWAMNKLDGLSERERKVVLAFSQRLVNKILHQPTVRLKQRANGHDADRYALVLRDLFGMDDAGGPSGKDGTHG